MGDSPGIINKQYRSILISKHCLNTHLARVGELKGAAVAHRPLARPPMGARHDSWTLLEEESTSTQEQGQGNGRAGDLKRMPP
jgi:hypothetical protein